MESGYKFPEIIKKNYDSILLDWMKEQNAAITLRKDLIKDAELSHQSQQFLSAFMNTIQTGNLDRIDGDEWKEVRGTIDEISKRRIDLGLSSSETATFIFSLKQPLFALIRTELSDEKNSGILKEIWGVTLLLDQLGLFSIESYQKTREAIIMRQQQEMLELSTPVVQIWDGILAVPLIGTLDSGRTQVVMETLLQQIISTESEIAIIDITGVPAVDTLVAQHLLKTIAAARLMGADCIISGIRPEIAQTIVHLGVDLSSVNTKATLAGALKLAIKKSGLKIEKTRENSDSESLDQKKQTQ